MATTNSFLDRSKLEKMLKEQGVIDVQKAVKEISDDVKSIITKHKRSSKKVNDDYQQAIPISKIYPNFDVTVLPSWLKSHCSDLRILGENTIIIPDGRKYQINNKLNDLSGGAWTYFTSSVLNTNYKTSGPDDFAFNIRKIHPSPKPPPLMRDIIEFFTKENEIVFDYFMGVGGSLLGASLCGRRSIGIDLNEKYIDAYRQASQQLGLPLGKTVCGDSLELLKDDKLVNKFLEGEKISLILIDPPYSNMMSKKKTGADIAIYGNKATPFTNDIRDLGNLERTDFFAKLKQSVLLASKYLKKRGYIVIFIKDMQPHKKETNLLHADIVKYINEIDNISYKGLKIWADQTSKLFPYGYPFSFVANQIHQYILIFRKEY